MSLKQGIMQKEIWKEIRGYEGLYYVSNLGNVRSVKRAGTKGGILKPKKRLSYSIYLKRHRTGVFLINFKKRGSFYGF